MSIRALLMTLSITVVAGLVYFQHSPFADSAAVFLQAARVTMELIVASMALTVVIAFAAGIGRLSKFLPVRWLSIAYVEIFRGTSALVQLFLLFYVLPLF
ncbi:MAG: ABC transporter permease subunit, partial [Rhodospirillales bacterium]